MHLRNKKSLNIYMVKDLLTPDYIFEASWEVCNKVGGIYTVCLQGQIRCKLTSVTNYFL